MIEAARFIRSLGEILLDPAADPEVKAERVRSARADLETLRLAEPSSDFTLADGGVRWGPRAVDVEPAEWMERLRGAGLTVLAPPNDEAGFERWVARLGGHLAGGDRPSATGRPGAGGAHAAGSAPALGGAEAMLREIEGPRGPPPTAPDADPSGPGFSVEEEADRVWWMHDQALKAGIVRYDEVLDIATALAASLDRTALEARARVIAPLDEYTNVHCLNVALLSMRLAGHLAFSEEEVLAVGVAGLLHDIGKVRLGDLPSVSREMLSPDERDILRQHPAEGARLLLDCGASLALAAIVAYEHHMHWQSEGGYPLRFFARSTHRFSRIVSVCDVYDVLRTERTFRPGLGPEAAAQYLGLLGGQSLDPELVRAFVDLVSGPHPRVATPGSRPPAQPNEIGWLPQSGYDPDCEPRPVRLG